MNTVEQPNRVINFTAVESPGPPVLAESPYWLVDSARVRLVMESLFFRPRQNEVERLAETRKYDFEYLDVYPLYSRLRGEYAYSAMPRI